MTNATIEKVKLGRDADVIMWLVVWDTHKSASGLGSRKTFKTKREAVAFASALGQ